MNLPSVWNEGFEGLCASQLKNKAAEYSRIHQLPDHLKEWKPQELRTRIWKSLGTAIDHTIPLDYRETGEIKLPGYTIKKICYQSRKGFYVTGNLYLPEGKGPFPGVINMHGHWSQGRLAARVQERGHLLALSGYVCLCVDAFGSGERATVHGEFEYHGHTLGGSLLNHGETLMGVQLVDNMRGVDLLCSLPMVDKHRIGATGASGGGNQTMWLAAMDERVKAAVPVVSVGTFESYIMSPNCICEMLPDGLTYTEEAGVLALVAPRALKICNCLEDSNPAFQPKEMLRSFTRAEKIFCGMDVKENFACQIFNRTHGYWPEIEESMLGWFQLHLKGIGHGMPCELPKFKTLPEETLMVFPKGKRPESVPSIEEYCIRKAQQLEGKRSLCRKDLRKNLRAANLIPVRIYEHSEIEEWKRFTVEASDGRLIPVLLRKPAGGHHYVIVSAPGGKSMLETTKLFAAVAKSGKGVLILDPWAAGENDTANDPAQPNASYARSLLWLGMTMQGKWVEDYEIAAHFLKDRIPNAAISAAGYKETALAALCYAALQKEKISVILEKAPASLAFSQDRRNTYTMNILVPDILQTADIPDLCQMAGGEILNIDPV